MPRHTQRLRRMTSRLGGNHEDRMERIPDEELEAELVEIAVQSGYDTETAARDPYAALSWVEEQLNASIDALPPDEQAEFIARSGDPREGRRMWPKRGQ